MATMVENVIAVGSENHTYGVTHVRRPQRVEDLAGQEKLRYDNDIKAVNILLLGLPIDIYTLINHYQATKEIWDRVKELMKGTKMTKQERKSMLYDEFDKFTSEPGESIHSNYMRYVKLINDMKMIPMFMSNMQINTKFVNHLQPEWSRPIRRIQDFDKLKDHFLTLNNTLYPHQRYAVYNTFVNEEEPTGFTSIRHIHQEDTAYPCLHFTRYHKGFKSNTSYPGTSIHRIQGLSYTKILEDIKRGPYSKKTLIRRIHAIGYAVSTRFQTL
ncbi:hypothetical protein Tco_0199756 [Tanacetum coccineum]